MNYLNRDQCISNFNALSEEDQERVLRIPLITPVTTGTYMIYMNSLIRDKDENQVYHGYECPYAFGEISTYDWELLAKIYPPKYLSFTVSYNSGQPVKLYIDAMIQFARKLTVFSDFYQRHYLSLEFINDRVNPLTLLNVMPGHTNELASVLRDLSINYQIVILEEQSDMITAKYQFSENEFREIIIVDNPDYMNVYQCLQKSNSKFIPKILDIGQNYVITESNSMIYQREVFLKGNEDKYIPMMRDLIAIGIEHPALIMTGSVIEINDQLVVRNWLHAPYNTMSISDMQSIVNNERSLQYVMNRNYKYDSFYSRNPKYRSHIFYA